MSVVCPPEDERPLTHRARSPLPEFDHDPEMQHLLSLRGGRSGRRRLFSRGDVQRMRFARWLYQHGYLTDDVVTR